MLRVRFQTSLAYTQQRFAGRAPTATGDDGGPAALIVHPDIRRMLLTQKAIAEGGRAFVLYCAKWVDLADSPDAHVRGRAEQRLALLTPIAKGALSEWATEATDLGIQILGGHGYMKDGDSKQRVRDVRITRIYEGTTGIQGMDCSVASCWGRCVRSSRRLRTSPGARCASRTSEVARGYGRGVGRRCESVAGDHARSCRRAESSRMWRVGSAAVDYLMPLDMSALAMCWRCRRRSRRRGSRRELGSRRLVGRRYRRRSSYFDAVTENSDARAEHHGTAVPR